MVLGTITLHQTPFTSTLHDAHKKFNGFNIWPIILTAVLFFLVLSWYNFVLTLFEYYTDQNNEDKVLRDNLFSALGFALIFTLLALLIYFILDSYNLLQSNSNGDENTHPLLPSEVRDVSVI